MADVIAGAIAGSLHQVTCRHKRAILEDLRDSMELVAKTEEFILATTDSRQHLTAFTDIIVPRLQDCAQQLRQFPALAFTRLSVACMYAAYAMDPMAS